MFFSFWVWSAFIYVFELSPSFLHRPTTQMNPTTDTINLFPALLTKTFLNFTLCFFCHLPVAQLHLSLLCPTTSQLYSLSLSLSLYLSYLYKQERESQTQSDRITKPKSQKKKKHHRPQHRVNSQSPASV